MVKELRKNGADLRRQCLVQELLTEQSGDKSKVNGVVVNGRKIRCGAVLSNANLKNTIEKLLGTSKLPKSFAEQAKSVRLNSTSCQVYIGLKKGCTIPDVGDLIFTSEAPRFSTDELTSLIPQVALFPYIILIQDLTVKIRDIVSLPLSTQNGKTGKALLIKSMRKKKIDCVKSL